MNFFTRLTDKNFWKLDFLNLTFFKWLIMIALALVIVIYAPWFVQFVLNTLFLITSFIVFMIIYLIVETIKQLRDKQ